MSSWLKPLLAASVVFFSPVAASPDYVYLTCSGKSNLTTDLIGTTEGDESSTMPHFVSITLDETNSRIRFGQMKWQRAVFSSNTIVRVSSDDKSNYKYESVFILYKSSGKYEMFDKATQPSLIAKQNSTGACARRDASNN